MEGQKWYESSIAQRSHINDMQILVLSTIVEDGLREKVVGVVRGVIERHFERERKLKDAIGEVLQSLRQQSRA